MIEHPNNKLENQGFGPGIVNEQLTEVLFSNAHNPYKIENSPKQEGSNVKCPLIEIDKIPHGVLIQGIENALKLNFSFKLVK